MIDVLLDSFFDSLKIFVFVFAINELISIFEKKISHSLEKSKKWSPVVGSFLSLIPQCSMSVVSTDLYNKKHITPGTLVAIYVATSDEAIPILFSNIKNDYLVIILLLVLKVIIGIIAGYFTDLILVKSKEEVHKHEGECEHIEINHKGCCNHEIEDENNIHRYLTHPLIHSIKIFIYCFIFNFLFGILIYFIGENNLTSFINSSKILSPLFAILIGFIPNCASSIFLSNLYLIGGIPFSSLLGGLIVNAGLGITLLFKNKENKKNSFIILLILFITAILSSYAYMLIEIM